MKAEDKRATAAIAAEDRRAAAAIAAEDRRHSNQLAHDDLHWRRETTADAYFRLLRAAAATLDSMRQARWYYRPRQGMDKYVPVNAERALDYVAKFNEASSDLKLLASTVRAVANPEIADLTDELRMHSSQLMLAVKAAIHGAADGAPYDEEVVGKEELARYVESETKLIAAVRRELGAPEVPVTPPGAR